MPVPKCTGRVSAETYLVPYLEPATARIVEQWRETFAPVSGETETPVLQVDKLHLPSLQRNTIVTALTRNISLFSFLFFSSLD